MAEESHNLVASPSPHYNAGKCGVCAAGIPALDSGVAAGESERCPLAPHLVFADFCCDPSGPENLLHLIAEVIDHLNDEAALGPREWPRDR